MTKGIGTRHFMSLQQVVAAVDYMRRNAALLMREQPDDAAFALELSKELGDTYSPTNARTLRLKQNVKAFVMDDKGIGQTTLVTWKVDKRGPRGPYKKQGFLKNNMAMCADIKHLTERVEVLEKVLRELGAQI